MNRVCAVTVICAVLSLTGCAKPPHEEINAARRVGSPDDLAPLEQELADQDKRFALFRSYMKTKEIAAGIVSRPYGTGNSAQTATLESTLDCACTCSPRSKP